MSSQTGVAVAEGRGIVVDQAQYDALNGLVTSRTAVGAGFGPVGFIGISLRDLQLRQRLRDGDVVVLKTYDNPDPSLTTFRLSLGPGVTWWKGVEIVNDSYQRMGMIECQDRRTVSDDLELDSEDLETGARMILWKAKVFGIHTAMYELPDLEQLRGKIVTLRWTAD